MFLMALFTVELYRVEKKTCAPINICLKFISVFSSL